MGNIVFHLPEGWPSAPQHALTPAVLGAEVSVSLPIGARPCPPTEIALITGAEPCPPGAGDLGGHARPTVRNPAMGREARVLWTRRLALRNHQKLIRGQTRLPGRAVLGGPDAARGSENEPQAPFLISWGVGKLVLYMGLVGGISRVGWEGWLRWFITP